MLKFNLFIKDPTNCPFCNEKLIKKYGRDATGCIDDTIRNQYYCRNKSCEFPSDE